MANLSFASRRRMQKMMTQVVEPAGVPWVRAASIANDARQRHAWVPVRVSASDEARPTVKHQLTLGASRFLVLASKEAY